MVTTDVWWPVFSNKAGIFILISILSDDIIKSLPFHRHFLQKVLSWIHQCWRHQEESASLILPFWFLFLASTNHRYNKSITDFYFLLQKSNILKFNFVFTAALICAVICKNDFFLQYDCTKETAQR